jgi:hypothetical protein
MLVEMTDAVEHGYAIAGRLRAEAAIADRPGQMNRLEAEADSVEVLADEVSALRVVIATAYTVAMMQSGKAAAEVLGPFVPKRGNSHPNGEEA